jgi:hypothetical protein
MNQVLAEKGLKPTSNPEEIHIVQRPTPMRDWRLLIAGGMKLVDPQPKILGSAGRD